MSTAYSGLSALIQAATSQLSDLAETNTSRSNSPEDSPHILSSPTTPTLDDPRLDLDETPSWCRGEYDAVTVTPLLTSLRDQDGVKSNFCFPEILMVLLINPENEDIVTFLPDGKYFAIRRLDFQHKLMYKHFQLRNFEDFLDLAHGWGFTRVNGNFNDSDRNESYNTNDGDCYASSGSVGRADIYVFRHSHFQKDRPVDLDKISFQSGDVSSTQDKTKALTILQETVSSQIVHTKRELSPSRAIKDVEYNRQRLRMESISSPTETRLLHLTGSPREESAQQARRRSSLELRGVAQAIAASKIHFNNNSEVIKDDEHSDNQDTHMIDLTDSSFFHLGVPESVSLPQSSLVDGGVETATHNIVTDAIEALLFDENHTRETYSRHQKELSVSSLPGVVPISKQLFSANDDNESCSNGQDSNYDQKKNIESSSNTRAREEAKKREFWITCSLANV